MEKFASLDLELYKNQRRLEDCNPGLLEFFPEHEKKKEKLLKENFVLQEKLKNIGPEIKKFLEKSEKFLEMIERKL